MPPGGVADVPPITNDALDLDIDVPTIYDEALKQTETPGILRGFGRAVTKEEGGGNTLRYPPNSNRIAQ